MNLLTTHLHARSKKQSGNFILSVCNLSMKWKGKKIKYIYEAFKKKKKFQQRTYLNESSVCACTCFHCLQMFYCNFQSRTCKVFLQYECWYVLEMSLLWQSLCHKTHNWTAFENFLYEILSCEFSFLILAQVFRMLHMAIFRELFWCVCSGTVEVWFWNHKIRIDIEVLPSLILYISCFSNETLDEPRKWWKNCTEAWEAQKPK